MAKQLPESAMEPRPRRVTLEREERCRQAWDEWVGPLELSMTMDERKFARNAWFACWRYLERQVQKEFIER